MRYSLLKEMGKPNRNGESKIYVLVKIDGKKIRIDSGYMSNGANNDQKDLLFNIKKNEIERRLLEADKKDIPITKELLESSEKVAPKQILLSDYVNDTKEELKGKLSEGRIRHYVVMYNIIEAFSPKMLLKDVNGKYLESIEIYMRKLVGINTVVSRISLLKAILHRAQADKLIPLDALLGYKSPSKKHTIPLYLTQDELTTLEKFLFSLANTVKKRIGMYFLLSCYAGYRISDLYLFNYAEKIRDNRITIRADKNGTIVSMPVHAKLKIVLDYVKDNPIDLPQTKFRHYIKQLAKDLGFDEKLHPHSARHTFAMYLMAKDFTVEEVAEYLGDTVEVARIYARISHKSLDDKILRAFQ